MISNIIIFQTFEKNPKESKRNIGGGGEKGDDDDLQRRGRKSQPPITFATLQVVLT